MIIAVGCDHGGFELKPVIIEELRRLGHAAVDCGAVRLDPDDDYPDITTREAGAVQGGEAARGIVVCGSGVGASVAANKLLGVRASVCHDTYSAHQGVEHDDMNVLCLGARVIGGELARELVRAFVGAAFSGEEKYRRRLAKVMALENKKDLGAGAGKPEFKFVREGKR
jgi:ribose 5-phosphate isomerase B